VLVDAVISNIDLSTSVPLVEVFVLLMYDLVIRLLPCELLSKLAPKRFSVIDGSMEYFFVHFVFELRLNMVILDVLVLFEMIGVVSNLHADHLACLVYLTSNHPQGSLGYL
jgi:hypothetical protein